MPTARARRATLTAGLALIALPAIAGTAQAVHWPFFGGDNGRSGYQPVGEGRTPVKPVYNKSDAAEQNIRTSIVTTAGQPSTQRLAWGSTGGDVHLQLLVTGAPVGPEGGTDIDGGDADADVFGGGDVASVSFADTSIATGLGQIFAAHNDDNQGGANDIAVAQVDEATGNLVQDVPVAGTDGYTISSSLLAGGPATDDPGTATVNETGNRALFFVASNGTEERLFRVPVTNNAGSTGATIGTATSTGDINATPTASPTITFLNNSGGTPAAFVAVGTQDGRVLTFAASNLAAGPASAGAAGRTNAQTPTVPITPSGNTPGAPMTGAAKAPFVYVAASADGGTQIQKLTQNGNSQQLSTVATSPTLAGRPAPALATDQETEATGPGEGKVIVTTGQNLHLVNAADLQGRQSLSSTALAPGTTGFSRTTAAASGDFIYVTRDNGEQLVVRFNAQPVSTGPADGVDFTSDPAARGSTAGFGQPSISRSFVQFASDRGAFVYRNACGNLTVGTPGTDNLPGTEAGDDSFGADGDDRVVGMVGDDCLTGNAGNDTLAGGDGDDFHRGAFGADTLFGGNGNDVLNAGSDNDRITGGPDDDVLRGAAGDDFLRGTAGDDRLSGGSGVDVITGGRGDDVITSIDDQADRVSCGPGDDRARVDEMDRVAGNCERAVAGGAQG